MCLYGLKIIFSVLQNISPNPSNGISHRVPPERPPRPPKFSPKPQNGIYPKVPDASTKKKETDDNSSDLDYEVLSPSARIKPTRPAPQPPTSSLVTSVTNYGTLPGSSDLDGVPFVLNPLLSLHTDPAIVSKQIKFYLFFFFAKVK